MIPFSPRRAQVAQLAATCRSCHSVSSLQTSLRLSRLDKKQTSVSPASAFVIGCGQRLSYGAESYAPHSWHSAHSAARGVIDEQSRYWESGRPRPRRRRDCIFHKNNIRRGSGARDSSEPSRANARPSASPAMKENSVLPSEQAGTPALPRKFRTIFSLSSRATSRDPPLARGAGKMVSYVCLLGCG